jgi:hypothetical protein
VGPRRALLSEEIESLRSYLSQRGGRLIAFLDADSPVDLGPLLKPYGLRFSPQLLLNDARYLRVANLPSDQANLVTRSFGAHPAVMTLARDPSRFEMLFSRAGSFERVPPDKDSPAQPAQVFPIVQAPPETWAERTFDHAFDSRREVRDAYWLAVAVSRDAVKGQQRLLFFADTDVVSDALLERPANQQALLDGLGYLGMDEELPVVGNAIDPIIRHTQRQDAAWFYGLSLGLPLLVLGAGLLGQRVRGRRLA